VPWPAQLKLCVKYCSWKKGKDGGAHRTQWYLKFFVLCVVLLNSFAYRYTKGSFCGKTLAAGYVGGHELSLHIGKR